MALTTFNIKQGDLLPPLAATLTLPDGSAYDLSAASAVKFLMRVKRGAAAVIDAAAVVTDGPNGRVRYDWSAGQTDVAGRFQGEFEAMVGGKPYSFPNDGYFDVIITDDIG